MNNLSANEYVVVCGLACALAFPALGLMAKLYSNVLDKWEYIKKLADIDRQLRWEEITKRHQRATLTVSFSHEDDKAGRLIRVITPDSQKEYDLDSCVLIKEEAIQRRAVV